MSSRFAPLLGMLAGVAVGACGSGSFSCQDDSACDRGWCEAQGWCSFPDDACDSGRRFGEHAGTGLARQCVGPLEGGSSDGDGGGPSTTTATSAVPESSSGVDTDPASDDGEVTLALDGSTSTSSGASTRDTTDGSTGGPQTVHVGPLSIAADEDDGQMYAQDDALTWLPSGEPGNLGFAGEFPTGARYFGYFRFALPIDIAADATIDGAVLSLHGQLPWQWGRDGYAMGIWVQDAADAPVVDNPSAMPSIGPNPAAEIVLRAGPVSWTDGSGLPWTVDAWNETPDLGEMLAAHVAARGGLAAGSHLQLWVAMYEPQNVSAEIGFVEYAFEPSLAARLQLDVTQ